MNSQQFSVDNSTVMPDLIRHPDANVQKGDWQIAHTITPIKNKQLSTNGGFHILTSKFFISVYSCSFVVLKCGFIVAKNGNVLDKFGVVLATFGNVLDNFGNVWDKLGNTFTQKNSVYSTKNAENAIFPCVYDSDCCFIAGGTPAFPLFRKFEVFDGID